MQHLSACASELRWIVSSTTPESGNPPTPSTEPANNGGEKSTSSGDTLFLVGAVPLAVIIGSGLFFKRLPEGLQHRLEQIVLDPVHRWVALGVAAVFATITAVAIVREIGHARLVAGWSFFRNLGPTGWLGLLNLIMPPLAGLALLWAMGATNIGPWMKSHGAIAVVFYAVAFAVLAGLSLLPTYAQAALGGWAFGVAWGLPAALVGFVGGALIGYGLARRLSGDRIEAIIDKKPKWKAVRDALVGTSAQAGDRNWRSNFWRSTGMIALLRLPPNSPFAFTNTLMASVKVPAVEFGLGTMLGMLPRTAIAVIIGAGLSTFSKSNLESAAPKWLWAVGIGVTLAIVLIVGIIANKAIDRMSKGQAPG